MNTQELLVFEIAGREFGVPLAVVEEVVPASQVTPVPDSPPFFLGLAAVRGRVMGVIDASRRYGLGPTLNAHFLICRVRGNLTAITIDRAIVAGTVPVRELDDAEKKELYAKTKVDPKFIVGAMELGEAQEDGSFTLTGHRFCQVDADLFVSAEMASRVGES